MLHLHLESRLSLKKVLYKNLILIVPFIIMIIEIYIIIFFVGTNKIGYAGLDSSILNTLFGMFSIITNLLKPKYLLILGLLIIFIGLFIYRGLFKLKSLFLPALLFLFIVIPNLILYAKSGFWGRYLLPSSVGFAFLVVSIVRAFEDNLRWLKSLALLAIFFFFIPFLRNSFHNAIAFANEGENIKLLVHEINENYHDSHLLIAVDPVKFYEQSYSFKKYLELEHNLQPYGYAINNSQDEEFAESQTRGWHTYFKGRTFDDMDAIPDMIIFLDKNLVNNFFEIADFEHSEYKNILDGNPSFALLIKGNQ